MNYILQKVTEKEILEKINGNPGLIQGFIEELYVQAALESPNGLSDREVWLMMDSNTHSAYTNHMLNSQPKPERIDASALNKDSTTQTNPGLFEESFKLVNSGTVNVIGVNTYKNSPMFKLVVSCG